MGYNTAIMILNDTLGTIEEHPDEFVRVIKAHLEECRTGAPFSIRIRGTKVGEITCCEHSGTTNVVLMGGNSSVHVGTIEGGRALNKRAEQKEVLRRVFVNNWGRLL